jgi:hypothetical protein
MARNNADFQGGQGYTITDESFDNPDYENARILRLHSSESKNVASLEYHTDPVGVAYIDYLRSPHSGQGHAEKLVSHFYQKFPRHNIDWGEIIHPAAQHLFDKFNEKHGRSYSWDDDHD